MIGWPSLSGVNRGDVGVIQRRRGLRFPLEALQSLAALGEFFGQELQRDKPVKFGVFRLVDDPHPARAKLLYNAVVRDGFAEHSV